MSNETRTPPVQSDAPPTDASGKPVNVVERDLQDSDDDTRAVDEVITPSSNRVKEQEVEDLDRKTAEIERKVADGN
ncbi:hypothetical protein SAMN03159444_00013 [Pseudomonas sp. NFACC02]|uniref:hypothetical protein n=1 Tax=Pseudomonas sp. NFACC02 TaxID=1566250 RepID=UPI0008B6C97B|nr:hypothetical protein [Pseudomonas sp. NFACC02]SEP55656.1 hypothetical protein SAMN03159444_00013 [Pseudomonas sp. NFACC02]